MTGLTAGVHARLMAAVVAMVMVASAVLVTVAPSQAAIAAPSGLRAQLVASQGVGLTWSSAGEGAYRVRFSTSSSMGANTDTWDVLGEYLDWTHMDANPTVTSDRLKPGGTYYFQVKAITDDLKVGDRDNLSSYSKPFKVTLPSSGAPELRPVRIKTTPAGPDGLYVSWPHRGPGVRYVVRYSTDPSAPVLSWESTTFDTAGGLLEGLEKNTRYHLRVRVVDRSGAALSDYSALSTSYGGTTAASSGQPRISMVSYNILKASGSPDWGTRRRPVADSILAQKPDVVALQEATPLTYQGVKQYDDIVGLLGSPYSLVSRTGSSGTKLVYNTSRLALKRTGVKALTTIGSATRYAQWAILEDRRTGGQFFVINTHLEPGSQDVAANNTARVVQAREVLALIDANADGLPVIIAGDMNSSRGATPANGQYDTFTGAGYVDLTDNRTASWASGRSSVVEHAMDWQYNSANKLASKPKRTAYPVGTNIDYVYTSRDVRAATWRTVVDVDRNGAFVGTIPSDHNMLAMHLHLDKAVSDPPSEPPPTSEPPPPSSTTQNVTAAPTLTMEKYQGPPNASTASGTTDIDVTWGSGTRDYSGVVKLQYYSGGWKTYGTWVMVGEDGVGRLSVPFRSSKTWRAFGARLDGVHQDGRNLGKGSTAKTMSQYSINTVRTKSPTTTPVLYATSMAKSTDPVPMLVSWNQPGGTFRLQYRSASGWKTHSTYSIPSGATQLMVTNSIRTSKDWRVATSTGPLKISNTRKLTMQ